MPEKPKGPPSTALPRNLPMPKYGYQKPATGSASAKYDPNREKDRHKETDCSRMLPSLQNLTF